MCDHTIATIRYEFVCYFSRHKRDRNGVKTLLHNFILMTSLNHFHKILASITPTSGPGLVGVRGTASKENNLNFGGVLNFLAVCLGVRMPEIPFPRTKILKIFRGKMAPKLSTGDRLRRSVPQIPSFKMLYPPQGMESSYKSSPFQTVVHI